MKSPGEEGKGEAEPQAEAEAPADGNSTGENRGYWNIGVFTGSYGRGIQE